MMMMMIIIIIIIIMIMITKEIFTVRSLVTFNKTYIIKLRSLKIIDLPSHIKLFPM